MKFGRNVIQVNMHRLTEVGLFLCLTGHFFYFVSLGKSRVSEIHILLEHDFTDYQPLDFFIILTNLSLIFHWAIIFKSLSELFLTYMDELFITHGI